MYWIAFGVGVGSGTFGLIRIIRYFLWMRIAYLSEAMGRRAENVVEDFREGRINYGSDIDIEKSGWLRLVRRIKFLTRCLWPTSTEYILVWAVSPAWIASEHVDDFGKQFLREVELDWGKFQEKMNSCKQDFDTIGYRCRDFAHGELVWATASFALGALIVGMYALWLQSN